MWWAEDLPGLSCLCPKLSLPLLEQREKPQTVPGLDVELCGESTPGANSVPFCVMKLGPMDGKLWDPQPCLPCLSDSLPACPEASSGVLCPWIPVPLDNRFTPGKHVQVDTSSFRFLGLPQILPLRSTIRLRAQGVQHDE